MSKEQALAEISALRAEINDAVDRIKELADEHDLSIYLDVDGEYGTGATYRNGEWSASSNNC